VKHTNNKPKNRDVRADGKVFDGHTWRKAGINHHCNEEGLIFGLPVNEHASKLAGQSIVGNVLICKRKDLD
jgi:hypothetical protein